MPGTDEHLQNDVLMLKKIEWLPMSSWLENLRGDQMWEEGQRWLLSVMIQPYIWEGYLDIKYNIKIKKIHESKANCNKKLHKEKQSIPPLV